MASQEMQTLRRLRARLKGRGVTEEPDMDMAPLWMKIVTYGEMLDVEHPYMLVLYPEHMSSIMNNDYSRWALIPDFDLTVSE